MSIWKDMLNELNILACITEGKLQRDGLPVAIIGEGKRGAWRGRVGSNLNQKDGLWLHGIVAYFQYEL